MWKQGDSHKKIALYWNRSMNVKDGLWIDPAMRMSKTDVSVSSFGLVWIEAGVPKPRMLSDLAISFYRQGSKFCSDRMYISTCKLSSAQLWKYWARRLQKLGIYIEWFHAGLEPGEIHSSSMADYATCSLIKGWIAVDVSWCSEFRRNRGLHITASPWLWKWVQGK